MHNVVLGEAIELATDTGDYAALYDLAERRWGRARQAWADEPYNRALVRQIDEAETVMAWAEFMHFVCDCGDAA